MKKERIISLLLLMSLVLSSSFSFVTPISVYASVKLTIKSVTVGVKMKKQLKVIGTKKKVKWSSSDKRVVTVSKKGIIKGRKKGTAKITAKVGKKKLYCKIKVRATNDTEKVFLAVNKARKANGLIELTWSDQLMAPAAIRAKEASQYWSHIRPDGRAWNTVSRYMTGENLGRKYESPKEIMNAWMNSPGHKANILRSEFRKLAIATYRGSDGTIYWCQAFGY